MVSSLLTGRIPWANWQFGPVEFATFSLEILVGAYLAESWKPFLWPVGLDFIVSSLWRLILWLEAMKLST